MNIKTICLKLLAMLSVAAIMLSGAFILPETNLPDIPTEPPVIEPEEPGNEDPDEPGDDSELDPLCEDDIIDESTTG